MKMSKLHLSKLLLLTFALSIHAAVGESPALVPQPKSMKVAQGELKLNGESRIRAASKDLEPLAKVLAGEIALTTGLQLSTQSGDPNGTGAGAAGNRPLVDIVLELDPTLKGEAYTLQAKESSSPAARGGSVRIAGGNYQSVASGTVTLLQLLTAKDSGVTLPQVEIADEPVYSYRGALIDLARKYHSPGGIEQVIDLCRQYKIRYLQLHLTDDQLFMFPSTKFPQLGKSNKEFARFEPGSMPYVKPYTLDELRGLEAYAKARGVYLVPELDLPGHSGRLIADAQEIFGVPGNGSTVNIASTKTLEALTILMNEVMDVFQSTPYVHLGADEVGLGGLDQTKDYKDLQAKLGIKSVHDLYCKFIVDLHGIVIKRGKKSLVWEEAWNADGAYPLPKDVIVVSWTHGRNPSDIVKSGYQVINASWTPLYVVRSDKRPMDFLFDWKVPMFGQGHLGNDTYTTLEDTQQILGTQLCSWENSESIEIQSLRDRLALVGEKSWNPTAGGSLEDFKTRYHHTDAIVDKIVNSIGMEIEGALTTDENSFAEPLTIALTPRTKGLTVKYTLDNSMPNEKWLVYSKPIVLEKAAHLRAGLFDAGGKQKGRLVGSWFNRKIQLKPNLATGKPVTTSAKPDDANAIVAVDGKADNADSYWDGGPGPQWFQVDLGNVQAVNFINVITYWDGGRHYQLNGEVSVNGKEWKKVFEVLNDTAPATAEGYAAKFVDTQARYVRINLLKNSANPSVHMVELIVEHQK